MAVLYTFGNLNDGCFDLETEKASRVLFIVVPFCFSLVILGLVFGDGGDV